MSKHTIEFDQQCSTCGGTGLYAGMGERDGFAVVCRECNGTGCYKFKHTYEDFEGRKPKEGARHVIEHNPGICCGGDHDFGGISYAAWFAGGEFPAGSEMRNHVCPAWWYQSVNYKLKPSWDKCLGCGSFSGCDHFADKASCWSRWDVELARSKHSQTDTRTCHGRQGGSAGG